MALSQIIGLFPYHGLNGLLSTTIPAYSGLEFLHHVVTSAAYEDIPDSMDRLMAYGVNVHARTRASSTALRLLFRNSVRKFIASYNRTDA